MGGWLAVVSGDSGMREGWDGWLTAVGEMEWDCGLEVG